MTIRKRPDLTARRQTYLGQSYWVVKEPIGLNYFRFQDEEYELLQKIDGNTSLNELKDWFEATFPPQKITLEELQNFIGMLHRSGLVIADVPGQGKQLKKRRDERKQKELLGALTNILCIRFKGIDPERFLNWLHPKVSWLFSLPAFIFSIILAISALTLVTVQFDVFYSKLPDFQSFFSPTNALWLMVILGLTKALHELGHGLSCTHFGGECHEMGLMILVLTPCPYCNVSDSWMLPNKWKRAAIGAAGMYVEVIIASIATFIWWFTLPGLLNMLCLNIIFISSVTTIMFNANPLLRYDGYYILADVMEIPNLRQKATTILSRKAADWFLGIEPPDDPFLPQRNQIFFALYSIAAGIYRWFVLFSILWFMHQIWKPYRLDVIGYAIISVSLIGLIGMPIYKITKFFYVPGRMHKVKKPRFYMSLAGLAGIIAFILFVPLPHSVICSLEVRAHDADHVYVEVPGLLEEVYIKPGDKVTAGQELAKLENIEMQIQTVKLHGEKDEYEVELKSLERQRYEDIEASTKIQQLQESIAKTSDQIKEQASEADRLTLRAPQAGTVMPPPWRPNKPGPDGQLPAWSGSPLQKKNLGAPLDEGTVFCLVGDPKKMEAVLYVDQGDIDFVGIDQEVEIKLDELPFQTFTGTIKDVAPSESKYSPERLSTKAGGELATRTDASGAEKPMSTAYQSLVLLDDPDGLLRTGLRGRAKIHTAPQTLGQRIKRIINQVINFKL